MGHKEDGMKLEERKRKCFVVMPFGEKKDLDGNDIDFDDALALSLFQLHAILLVAHHRSNGCAMKIEPPTWSLMAGCPAPHPQPGAS